MSPASPTAHTSVADTAVTAVRPTPCGLSGSGCGGSGTSTTRQAVPSQCSPSGSSNSSPRPPTAHPSPLSCSTSGRTVPGAVTEPTAHRFVAPTATTPDSAVPAVGRPAGTSDQRAAGPLVLAADAGNAGTSRPADTAADTISKRMA